MHLTKSRKAAFVRHEYPDKFTEKEKQKKPWLSHRVALLLQSSRADSLLLCCPKEYAESERPYARVVPQGNLQKGGIIVTARQLQAECLTAKLSKDKFVYLGSSLGGVYRGGHYEPYGQYFHWVGVIVSGKQRTIRKNSQHFNNQFWCFANQLLSLDDAVAMPDRDYIMTLQALVMFGGLSSTNHRTWKLANAAGNRLQTVA